MIATIKPAREKALERIDRAITKLVLFAFIVGAGAGVGVCSDKLWVVLAFAFLVLIAIGFLVPYTRQFIEKEIFFLEIEERRVEVKQ